MGSSQPPDSDLPFGYNIDAPSQEYFNLDAPEASGPPLLNENDAMVLNSFFDHWDSGQLGGTSFGEGLNFTEDWGLPPQFMGATTSFGPRPGAQLSSPVHVFSQSVFSDPLSSPAASLMPPPPPPAPPVVQPPALTSRPPQHNEHPSADVLAAASVLQNGSLPRLHGPRGSLEGVPESIYGRNMPMAIPVDRGRHHPGILDFRPENDQRAAQAHLISPHESDDTLYSDMLYGPVAQRQETPRPNNPPDVEFHWGSDSGFNANNFVPQSNRETSQALESERIRYIGCLRPSESAASTRPPSPALNGDSSPLRLKTRGQPTSIKPDPDSQGLPRKRRRCSKETDDVDDEEEEESSANAAPKAARRRKPKVAVVSTSPPPLENSGKRRKSNANGAAKPSRENLTEEQKRENHIKSEQKRRTLIKGGFDELNILVPGLSSGGFSKSGVLSTTAEFVQELIEGNAQLENMGHGG